MATSKSNVSKQRNRLGVCEVCEKIQAKYICPRCKITSCSLQCVQKHKTKHDCDGIRSKTEFMKKNQFTPFVGLSDYRLLEEIAHRVDSCERDKLNASHLESLPMRMHKLKLAIIERGARLICLPLEFQQRKENTSYFDPRSKTVSWRIQLNFLNAKNLTIHQEGCSENMVLRELIEKYLEENTRFPHSVFQKLASYRIAGIDSITVLMKTEKVPQSDKKFYKLDLQQTIRKNLVGKIIVEFPQLYVLVNGFFKTENTELLTGGLKVENKTKSKNLLVSAEKKSSFKPLRRLQLKKPPRSATAQPMSDSSSVSDLDWDDTEDVFNPWYKDVEAMSS